MKNGDNIKITYLPSCINVPRGTPNPYIGMSGTVDRFDGNTFDLFTGSSYLCGVKLKTCRYEKITENYRVQH